MKNFFYASVVTVLLSGASYAGASDNVDGKVTDVYQTITRSVPSTERVCYDVEVPIYGQKKFDQGGAIIGGLLGGFIGNQFGSGSGKDAMTGIGAMTGAIAGGQSNEKQIVGYRQENRCEKKTTYTEKTETVYSHSIIKFYRNGVPYTLRFQK